MDFPRRLENPSGRSPNIVEADVYPPAWAASVAPASLCAGTGALDSAGRSRVRHCQCGLATPQLHLLLGSLFQSGSVTLSRFVELSTSL